MKLHVPNGPLPLLPPYITLDADYAQNKLRFDLKDAVEHLIREQKVRRLRADFATSTLPLPSRLADR